MKVEIQKSVYVEKGWGMEEHCINSKEANYCGKILWFKPDSKLSMHNHKVKDELFKILYNKFKFIYIDTDTAEKHEMILNEGDIVHIPPMLPHQLICIGDTSENRKLPNGGGAIIEFSTYSDDKDSYRYEKGDSQK